MDTIDPPGETTPEIRPRPRMQDISEVMGVSIKTVSRALNGDPNVRESTRARIVAEADRLGFQPNDIAAGLRRKTTSMTTIGVMVGDFSNPFFSPMLKGIHSVAGRHGFLVLTADSQSDPEEERRSIRSFFAHRIAGLIIAPTGDDLGYLENEAAFGSALVFVDSAPPGLGRGVDSVTTTNVESTRDGVAELIARGNTRIAFLGHPFHGTGAEERWLGYSQAHAAAGLAIDPSVVRRDLTTEDEATAAVETLLTLPEPPTAIFADNNRLCIGVLQSSIFAAHRIDVLSFDDFPLAAQFGVSIIDSNPFGVGSAGAEALFRRLADPTLPPQKISVPARLVLHKGGIY